MGETRQTSLKTSLLERAAPTKTILTAEQAISGPRMTAASALAPTATTTANNIRAASVATSGMTLQAAAVAPTTSTTTATTVRNASTTPTMRTTVTDRGPGSSGGGSGY